MKKIILSLLAFILPFIGISSVNAIPETYERNENNKYGVNKKWTINNSNMSNVLNTKYVDAEEKIYDFADILTESEKTELKDLIEDFLIKYNTELIILTVNESYSYDQENETIAADFYDYNDFGLKMPRYDGILIYRNAYSLDPYYDIYTFGDAQLYFNQGRYDYVLDNAYSYISNKLYLQGFKMMIEDIEHYYKQGIPSDKVHAYVDDMGYIHYAFNPPILIALLISGVITLIVILILVNLNKMVKQETSADIYLDMSSINFKKRINEYLYSRTTSYQVSSSSGGSSGGGGHSSSGSSGGGHSSGGGRHG